MKCKIVNADDTNADPNNFPGLVQIRSETNRIYCGGVKIGPGIVVTAAHCVYRVPPRQLRIIMNLSKDAPYGYDPSTSTVVNITRIVVHPMYNRDKVVFDIALVFFSPTRSTNRQSTAMIGGDLNPAPGTPLVIAGYGAIRYGDKTSGTLRSANIQVMDIKDSEYDPVDKYPGNFLAGDYENPSDPGDNQDACQGDSGGPVYSTDFKLLGLTSWGEGCGLDFYPGFYTNVAYFAPWIMGTRSMVRSSKK